MNAAGAVYRGRRAQRILWLMNITTAATENNATGDTTSKATLWNVDCLHSTVGFAVRHLMITNVRGVFETLSGTVLYDPSQPEATQVDVSIASASVHSRDRRRDDHLCNPDFFHVEKYPTITFRSTRVRRGDGHPLDVIGLLTLRGITREVLLTVHEVTGEHRDFHGARRIGAAARAKVRRSDFGIVYNPIIEAGGVAIADEVFLSFDLSMVESARR